MKGFENQLYHHHHVCTTNYIAHTFFSSAHDGTFCAWLCKLMYAVQILTIRIMHAPIFEVDCFSHNFSCRKECGVLQLGISIRVL